MTMKLQKLDEAFLSRGSKAHQLVKVVRILTWKSVRKPILLKLAHFNKINRKEKISWFRGAIPMQYHRKVDKEGKKTTIKISSMAPKLISRKLRLILTVRRHHLTCLELRYKRCTKRRLDRFSTKLSRHSNLLIDIKRIAKGAVKPSLYKRVLSINGIECLLQKTKAWNSNRQRILSKKWWQH